MVGSFHDFDLFRDKFFGMRGNWFFGDNFKKEVMKFAWAFCELVAELVERCTEIPN
jgi:hypothetical protein